ncbi:MAG: DNA methyltransferase [Verrucomicrobiota bacterium]
MFEPTPEAVSQFITRWENSGGSEKANYALFLTELCDQILGVDHPDPAGPDTAQNRYTFERTVTHKESDGTTATGFIDLYKAGAFVLETKQGTFDRANKDGTLVDFLPSKPQHKLGHGKRGTASFDKVLERAYNQARKYITSLPAADGRPPFLIVCDVGHSFDLYAEFSGTGGHYERFPDPVSHRITLSDLHRPEIRERLRRVWADPLSLDPAKHAAAVTREVARALAELAKSIDKDGHNATVTAGFLQRSLFTMFAEDVGLLPENSFLQTLEKVKDNPTGFPIMISALWKEMATGTPFSTILLSAIPHFNGGLFEDTTALPLRTDQIALLINAAKSDWSAVEPAIFGTLVERALDPVERHKLGAHFTPRSYVERLVRPTLIEPLREEWEAVKAAAYLASEQGAKAEGTADAIAEEAKPHIQTGNKAKVTQSEKLRKEALKQAAAYREEALGAVRDFHRKLCTLRVLDPACGAGNFLYVCLELMKRLEAEVLEAFENLGGDAGFEMASFKVGPRQFLGLELNHRAVAIAQLVLWIGFFQWQKKTTGKADTNERPLLPKTPSILQQDAVLAYDSTEPVLDASGLPVTRWDGRTLKRHPVTGEEVPDETARVPLLSYLNPRPAVWPEAEYIVGNPPFIGTSRMRDALGDGYTKAVRATYPDVPESADFVMYWWHKAALLVLEKKSTRFGFITTNSLRQTFNRRVLEQHLGPDKLSLLFAIPDHPWVDSADGAAVRIAMTVGVLDGSNGRLVEVIEEIESGDETATVTLTERVGLVHANLALGANVGATVALEASNRIANRGFELGSPGFIVTHEQAMQFGLDSNHALTRHIRPYVNGRDLMGSSRGSYVIDLFGLNHDEVQQHFPEVWQWLRERVLPDRSQNRDPKLVTYWWLHRRSREDLRTALTGLPRYIATVETAKHRTFQFLDASVAPDNMLVVIATDDAFFHGVLSSHIHVVWALASGGTLEDRPRYNKTRCFETFPFPEATESQRTRIRELGERLDAHRKRQQSLHPKLTLTDTYNVLEKLRSGEALSAKEKITHEQGLVTVLKEIHDALDTAVAEAYGVPADADDDTILTHLCDLNAQRAVEEHSGLVRWLRPEFQNPTATAKDVELAGIEEEEAVVAVAKPAVKLPWPKTLTEQVQAVQSGMAAFGAPTDGETLAKTFKGAKGERVGEILETLASLGRARAIGAGKYAAV